MMGCLVLDNGHIVFGQYEKFREKFIHEANRQMQWDSSVSLPELRELIPEGDCHTVDGVQQAVDALCRGVNSSPGSEVVDLQRLELLEAPHSMQVRQGLLPPMYTVATTRAELPLSRNPATLGTTCLTRRRRPMVEEALAGNSNSLLRISRMIRA